MILHRMFPLVLVCLGTTLSYGGVAPHPLSPRPWLVSDLPRPPWEYVLSQWSAQPTQALLVLMDLNFSWSSGLLWILSLTDTG